MIDAKNAMPSELKDRLFANNSTMLEKLQCFIELLRRKYFE